MAGREGHQRTSFRTIAELTLLPIAALSLFFGWMSIRGVGRDVEPNAKALAVEPAAVTRTPPKERGPAPVKRSHGSIALIIDDLGFDSQPLERAMAIDPDISFAILPNSLRAASFAERLNARGFEILCHLPMEPMDSSVSPGDNAVLTSMSDSEIVTATRGSVSRVPHARGVNNHMGSRATADRRVMASVMNALPKDFYFIDSRTGARSVAATVAREMNIRTAARHVFLDDEKTEAAVRRQLRTLARVAEEQGVAIGIGHPHEVTLRVLREEVPRLRARGFVFVRASEVVR
ncbi:MAG: divergent polysaccharide deacetylase family protein [Thermoanaerobaculia bacterium]|nr:divergent polysaccharide deacetylase family protein [Thermoanaerobaculia bacterium]